MRTLPAEIYTKSEIKEAWLQISADVKSFYESASDEDLQKAPEGKWLPLEHFDHLCVSAFPIATGLKTLKPLFRVYGFPNRPSMKYSTLVKTYQAKLAEGGQASGKFIPKMKERADLLNSWDIVSKKIEARMILWTEKQLDRYQAVHPLLGKLTIRELLMFTVYHTSHHLKAVEAYE